MALRFAAVAERMPEVEEVVATGGAMARNPAWTQIVADALGLPVTLSAVEEASARGAAVVALERLGESPATAPLAQTFVPRSGHTEIYRAALARQRELYDALT